MQSGSLLPQVHLFWKKHAATLAHLFPPYWEQIMMKSGWVEATKNASTMTKANIEVHIRRAIVIESKKYVSLIAENDNQATQLRALLTKPWSTRLAENIGSDVVSVIYKLRTIIGLHDNHYMSQLATSVSPRLLSVILFMHAFGILGSTSLMPRTKLSRKFAFLDNQCLKYMFPTKYKEAKSRQGGQNFQEESEVQMFNELGFSLNHFKEMHKFKRKRIIKNAQMKKNKQLAKKWKRRGCPKIPNESRITSIKTDGVALCLTLTYPLKIPMWPTLEPLNKDCQDQPMLEQIRARDQRSNTRPIFVGIDTGRAKLYCGAILKNKYENPSHVEFARRMYYSDIQFRKRKKSWTNRIQQNPELKMAFEDMSNTYTVVQYSEAQKRHKEVLFDTFIRDKTQSFQAMWAWRLKRSSKAKVANHLIKKVSSPFYNTLIGIGNCTVAPSSKHELSVPTKSIFTTLSHAICVHNQKNRYKNNDVGFISSISINEHRTTLVCCDCASVTFPPLVKKNNQWCRSTRFRECSNCNIRRDRDHQASNNILCLTVGRYRGEERPPHFS